MRIAFLCGGLGLGGVADYTRLLAGALRAHGVESLIIGLADREAPEIARGGDTLALPAALPWRLRIDAAEAALAAFAPDWVSLQFVPFAFNRKGVVALEARALARLIGSRRSHVMMHELWVEPLPRPVALRRRLLRAAQRASILRLLGLIGPDILHTSNAVYEALLMEAGFTAARLPLFGNVPIEHRPDRTWLDAALAAAGHDPARRPLLFGFFGGVDPEWDGTRLLGRLAAALARIGRTGLVLSAGAAAGMPERLRRWAAGHRQLGVLALGIQPIERISSYLQALDFGLTSYPHALIGKSSSVIAMLEHGVPVIVSWGDLRPDLPAIEPEWSPLLLPPGVDLAACIAAPRERRIRGSLLNPVAAQLLAEISPREAPEKGVKASRHLG
jgi:hypothetical protein